MEGKRRTLKLMLNMSEKASPRGKITCSLARTGNRLTQIKNVGYNSET